MYILKVYSMHIHWNKTQIFKKVPSDQTNDTKKSSIFFCELQLITVLLLICDSYMSWSTRFASLKLCVGFFHFQFRFVFNKVYVFFQQNAWTLWLQKIITPFKIKIIEKPDTVLLPDVWFLSCKKKF